MSQNSPNESVSVRPAEMPAKRKRTRRTAATAVPVPKRMRPLEVRLFEAERGVRIVCGQKLWDTLVRRAGISKMTPAELLREPLQAFLGEIGDESSAFVANFDVLLEKQMELLSAEIAAAARPLKSSEVKSADFEPASCSEGQESFCELTPVSVPSPASEDIPDPAMEFASRSAVADTFPEQAPVPAPSPASEDFPDSGAQPTPRIRTHWRDLLAGIRRPGRRAPLTG